MIFRPLTKNSLYDLPTGKPGQVLNGTMDGWMDPPAVGADGEREGRMGFIRNHAIVVTAGSSDELEKAHAAAVLIFPWVSPISPGAENGSRSFFIPPDGSKEGWRESDLGDARREAFKRILRGMLYDDKSSPLDWCEIYYGGSDVSAAVVDDGDKDFRQEHPDE